MLNFRFARFPCAPDIEGVKPSRSIIPSRVESCPILSESMYLAKICAKGCSLTSRLARRHVVYVQTILIDIRYKCDARRQRDSDNVCHVIQFRRGGCICNAVALSMLGFVYSIARSLVRVTNTQDMSYILVRFKITPGTNRPRMST